MASAREGTARVDRGDAARGGGGGSRGFFLDGQRRRDGVLGRAAPGGTRWPSRPRRLGEPRQRPLRAPRPRAWPVGHRRRRDARLGVAAVRPLGAARRRLRLRSAGAARGDAQPGGLRRQRPRRAGAAAAGRALAAGAALPPPGRLRDGRHGAAAPLGNDPEFRPPEPLRVPDLLGDRRRAALAALSAVRRAGLRVEPRTRPAADTLRALMGEHVLITGGAGFIGSHLGDTLLQAGHKVRALDSLVAQVHGESQRPDYLADEIELIAGDVRNAEVVRGALEGIDAVVHLAARVGVAQSMYEPAEYAGANTAGTGVLLEALLDHPVRKLVVASSMSIYGEGASEPAPAAERSRERLERGEWDPHGPNGEEVTPVPTPETERPSLSSVYALTKYDQERMCLLHGSAYDVPTVALRFFNTYGPRQALSNPYTGALAIFASRLLNDRSPLVYEDGAQLRDFVHVTDVARACRSALERDGADGQPVNVGSGRGTTILEVGRRSTAGGGRRARLRGAGGRSGGVQKKPIEPDLPGTFRAGDIRHCFADV